MDETGHAVAVWKHYDGSHSIIQAVTGDTNPFPWELFYPAFIKKK
jgi:hypothetical protein